MSSNKTYNRKNDTYYITLLLYVLFAVVYIAVTGTIADNTVMFGLDDPVIYIIGVFVLYAVARLIMNIVRAPRIVFEADKIVFKTRFGHRTILHDNIRTILLRRESDKFSDNMSALVKIRVSNRKRWYRIRVSNFEHEQELYAEFKELRHSIKAA